jgi:hypothetical protein
LDVKTEGDLDRYKSQLKNAIVLMSAPREVKAHFEPRATRRTDKQLLDLADAAPSRPGGGRRGGMLTPEARAAQALALRKLRFLDEEKPLAQIEASRPGDDPTRPTDGGTLFVTQAGVPQPPMAADAAPGTARRRSIWDKDAPATVPQIVLSVEQYNRFVRMIQAGEKLTMTLDLGVQYHDDATVANTIAEIPGTDPSGQIVMLGAHLDSWHSGTGATDNAAGVAACMEAVRILETLHVQPKRTIRIGLWTGEEEGLLGSKAYVAEHFGKLETQPAVPAGQTPPPAKVTPGPEYEKLSAYYNLDNGSGKIRGIFLQGNEALRPLFREWLAPFKDLDATTVTAANTGSTDHASFDAIGLPGFQFIQDDLEYFTRTHHSNQDVYDRLSADDLKQASVILAAFVYRTAMADERLPRKPR